MKFYLTQKVLFKHCDPAGIVFYPRYFEMINDSVETFFDEVLGYPYETMHATNGVPTVQISTSFKAASRHGDTLEIAVVPTRIGGASLDMSIIATCAGETRFTANLTLVYVRKDMGTERWPDELRAIISSHIQSESMEAANG